jgi:hypothetical protein
MRRNPFKRPRTGRIPGKTPRPIAGDINTVKPANAPVPAWVNEAQSQHVGQIKEKREVFIKMYRKHWSEAKQWNTMKFVDQAMNIFVMFGDLPTVEMEDCILVKATIKRHQENAMNGSKETVIHRVKLLKNVGSQMNPKNIDYAEVPDEAESDDDKTESEGD